MCQDQQITTDIALHNLLAFSPVFTIMFPYFFRVCFFTIFTIYQVHTCL